MNQRNVSVWKFSLPSGLYIGIALVVFNLILYFTGNTLNNSLQNISIAIVVAGTILAQLHFRRNQENLLSYGQGVGLAAVTMLAAGFLTMIYTYLLYKVIDPEIHQQLIMLMEEETTRRFSEQGMSEEQLQMTINIQKKFQTPFVLALGTFVNTFITGLLAGLITSAFIKKKPAGEIVS